MSIYLNGTFRDIHTLLVSRKRRLRPSQTDNLNVLGRRSFVEDRLVFPGSGKQEGLFG